MICGASFLDTGELRNIEFFRHVSTESIEGILEACSIRELQTGEVLLGPGQVNSDIYFVLSGRLRMHPLSLESPPQAVLGVGDSIGALSLTDKALPGAFAVADEPCRLLVMKEEILWALARASHEAAYSLLHAVAKRLRQADGAISEAVAAKEEYLSNGALDALTGLYNRHWLRNSLPRHMTRCAMSGKPLCIILIDLDHFKQFNHAHGYLCGDKALQTVGRVFLDNLRITEAAARYGGDEFLILLPEVNAEKARKVAERLREATKRAIAVLPDGRTLPPVTLSLGIAQAQPGDSPETLLTAAIAALQQAKEAGRDRTAGG